MSKWQSQDSDIPELCKACEARDRGICGALNGRQLQRLAQTSRRRKFAAGEEFASQGLKAESFGNVLRGAVRLSRLMEDGREQIVGVKFAPDFIGRPFQEEHRLTAEAAVSTEMCVFPRAALEQIAEDTPAFSDRLHRQALRELDDAREWLLTLGRKTAREKVASFIVWIAENSRGDLKRPERFDLPLARSEIADFLGLTIETVSRQFSKLRAEGLILLHDNRSVVIPSWLKLEEAAGGD